MITEGNLSFSNGAYSGDILEDTKDDSNKSLRVRHGNGTMKYSNGCKYTGEWIKDLKDGTGEYVWPDGRKYKGQFKVGNMHGQGEMTWPDGRKYVGEYNVDMIHGHGIVVLPDGRAFEGEFRDDYPVQGQLMEADGETFHASFDGATYVSEWRPLTKIRVGFFESGWCGTESSRSLREFVWNDGRRFAGSCKGYCPLVGALTDLNRMQYAVLYAGNVLFTEELVPLVKLCLKTQVLNMLLLRFLSFGIY